MEPSVDVQLVYLNHFMKFFFLVFNWDDKKPLDCTVMIHDSIGIFFFFLKNALVNISHNEVRTRDESLNVHKIAPYCAKKTVIFKRLSCIGRFNC